MKQTAVEWLESEMLKPNLGMKDIFEQAKEMEKEQQGYSKQEVDELLDKLLKYNMCSFAGDKLINKFKNK